MTELLFSSSADLVRLLQTVRHLKPTQICHRALHRLPSRRPDASPAPPLRKRQAAWMPAIERPRCLLGRWKVRFLNEDGEISRADQWNDPAKAKLWLYNLHYFDDLSAAADGAHHQLQRDFLNRWIAENPPGQGNGWEPYPTSLRISNWIKWALAGAELERRWLDSLAQQTRWLSRHIEWHLLGNHLLANAKALVLAGLFFDGPEADGWLAKGLAILARELPEQILSDGGHFELSPMYHAIILEDLLDLINAARTCGRADNQVFQDIPAITTRMRQWLAFMTHPDGEISFFNDAAFGIAPNRAALEAYATRLGLSPINEAREGVHHLEASGYIRVNQGDMAAILDLAAIGPDYIPGHGHADTFSFELSLGTERIIVNSATSTYEPGFLREFQRATSAHSTVEIDGKSSSDVWGSFRVGRRARVHGVRIDRTDQSYVITGSHDGYIRLPGTPIHTRTWIFSKGRIDVVDTISPARRGLAVARVILAPGLIPHVHDDHCAGNFDTCQRRKLVWECSTPAQILSAHWYPEFGRMVPSSQLVAHFSDRLRTTILWS